MSNLLLALSDVSRLVVTGSFWWFVIKFWNIRNGLVLRRFADFIVALALTSSWITLVHFDRRFDVLPMIDLNTIALEWQWVSSAILVTTLLRLGQALLRTPT